MRKRVEQVKEGLEIFLKYEGGAICAEHDIIYCGPDIEVSEEDARKLEELGWHRDDEGWARFV